MKITKLSTLLLTGLITLSTCVIADDLSLIVAVDSPYSATDVASSISIEGGYSIYNGNLYTWNNGYAGAQGYRITNLATDVTSTIGQPETFASNGYGDAFGEYNSVTSTFYVGTYDSSGSGIYAYSNGSWSSMGIFESLYAADFDGSGNVYLSGLNEVWNGSTGQDNQIAMMDASGNGSHDVLIQADGNSAGVAVDSAGNVYYANYNGSNPTLYRWTADQIATVRADLGNGTSGGDETDIYLTYDDATILTTLGGNGANGISVDDGGNVFVSVNGSASQLLMWNETMGYGESDNFEVIATLDSSQPFGWFGDVEADGNFLNGGTVYVGNYGSGLAAITSASVPEPATICLLAGGAVAALLKKKRKV